MAAVTRRWDEADAWAREALELARASANPTSLAYALYANGLASKHRDPTTPSPCSMRRSELLNSVRNEWFGGIARMERASTRASHGDVATALAEFAEVIDGWSRAGDLTQLRLTWRYAALALMAVERHEDAAVRRALCSPSAGRQCDIQVRLPGIACRKRWAVHAYDRLLVPGSVLQVWELVRLSLAAMAAAGADVHRDVPLTSL